MKRQCLFLFCLCFIIVLSSCKGGNQRKTGNSNDETQLSGDVPLKDGNGSFVYANGTLLDSDGLIYLYYGYTFHKSDT